MRRPLINLPLLFTFLFLTATAALGQNTGTITGIVGDQSGAVVAGANVTANNPNTNFSRTAVSGSNGFYRLDQLPVGVYSISVEAAGFKKLSRMGVALDANTKLALGDMALEVGAVTESIEVSAQAALLLGLKYLDGDGSPNS